MTSTNIGPRLRSCNCIADAKKVLQETKVSPTTFNTAATLFETAFAINGNPAHVRKLKETAIKEVEDDLMSTPSVAKVGKGEKDVKKLVESGDIVSGSGTEGSEQSSDTEQPYPKEGTEGEVTDMEDSSGDDQMKEGLPGMGGMPQMPPQQPGGFPPIAPELMKGMQPQLPPGLNPQVMQQMQYTVKEALKPYTRQISRLNEAVKALDSRVRETETNKGSMTLDIGSVKEHAIVQSHPIQETTNGVQIPRVSFPRAELEETRSEILELNNRYNEE